MMKAFIHMPVLKSRIADKKRKDPDQQVPSLDMMTPIDLGLLRYIHPISLFVYKLLHLNYMIVVLVNSCVQFQ